MNSKDIYTSFIIEIINERKKRGITQVELAKMIGVPQSTIGRMENLSHVPKLDTICKILFVLNKYPKLVELQYTIDKSIIKKQIDLWDPINLLSFCPSVYVNKVVFNDKYITLIGGVNVDICYISDEEKSILRSYQTNFEFSEDIAGENVNTESAIQNSISILLLFTGSLRLP